jgi:hypothetical protein
MSKIQNAHKVMITKDVQNISHCRLRCRLDDKIKIEKCLEVVDSSVSCRIQWLAFVNTEINIQAMRFFMIIMVKFLNSLI